MKIGIMQPYFLPYIGYWQLLNAVDQYVIYDDVNFIKGGWINRNRILFKNEPAFLNVPLLGASPNKRINEIEVNPNTKERFKAIEKVRQSYRKAPQFEQVFPWFEEMMLYETNNLAEFLTHSIREVCSLLNIQTRLLISSQLQKDCELKGQEKVLHICKLLGATEYYNAIGGQKLYLSEAFLRQGIELKFLQTNEISYHQEGREFVANLSILDVFMYSNKADVQNMLKMYKLA